MSTSYTSSKILKSPLGDRDLNRRKNKVAIVTGSNQGIGYAIVKALCEKFDGDVYLTAPTEKQGEAGMKSLNDLGYQPKFHLLDITVPEHVQKLRDHIVEQYGGLDILVNNAGIGTMHLEHLDSDELRTREIMRVNYFGFRDTCNTLLPVLKPHARVVNITSCTGHLTLIPGEHLRNILASPDLTEEQVNSLIMDYIKAVKNGTRTQEGWPEGSPYGISKMAVSALSRIHQRELLKDRDRPDIVVNHVHPGPADTIMMKNFVGARRFTVEQAAETPVFLALLPEYCTKPKGDFVWFTKEIVDWVNGPMPSWELKD